jgi:uncharacterized membrane protein YsdA (DUF1294 family)
MLSNRFKRELKKYTIVEKIVFYITIFFSLIIIFLSQTLFQTKFGKASLAYGLTSLALITMLRVLKIWGPK